MAEALTVASTSLDEAVLAVAYNLPGTRLAAVSASKIVKVYDDSGEGGFAATTQLQVDGRGFGPGEPKLVWAHPEFGQVLAGCFGGTAVTLWAEGRGAEGKEWRVVATLQHPTTCAVRDIAFAPKEYGPQLAVALSDGTVRIYEGTSSISAAKWELVNSFRASSKSGDCSCLCWREATIAGPPPLILVGTSSSGASLWRYHEALLQWEEGIKIGEESASVSCLGWAPALGRPRELVAMGVGRRAEIWTIAGPTDGDMSVEKVADLEVSTPVWKLEWNMLGTSLAISTEAGEVLVYAPTMLGKFELTGKFVKDNETAAATDAIMAG